MVLLLTSCFSTINQNVHAKNHYRIHLTKPFLDYIKYRLCMFLQSSLPDVLLKRLTNPRICRVTGKSRLASLTRFFILSLSFSLWTSRGHGAFNSLFMRIIMKGKALHSVALPLGLACISELSFISHPIQKCWWKGMRRNQKAKSRLFLNNQGMSSYDEKVMHN